MGHVKTFKASEARANFADLFDEAFHEKTTIVITKRDKSVALVPIDVLRILTELDASLDIEAATKSLEEFMSKGGTPMEDVKRELGLD
jgi:prevent-host-death family protein